MGLSVSSSETVQYLERKHNLKPGSSYLQKLSKTAPMNISNKDSHTFKENISSKKPTRLIYT